MKHSTLLFFAALFACVGQAQAAPKPCEELKAEIAAKLDAKGVLNYVLTIVENANVGDATVVGSCDGGTRKITYVRN